MLHQWQRVFPKVVARLTAALLATTSFVLVHGSEIDAAVATDNGATSQIDYTVGFNVSSNESHIATVGDSNFPGEISNATWEMWIKPSVLSSTAENHFLAKEHSVTLAIQMGEFAYAFGSGTSWLDSPWVSTGVKATVDEWQHVAFVKSGSDLQFYVNGQLAYEALNSTKVPASISSNNNPFTIGNRQIYVADGSALMFQGYLDEVKVWSVARQGPDIAAGMHQREDTAAAGLLAYWDFNESSGDIVHNRKSGSASSSNLTLSKGHDLGAWDPARSDVKISSPAPDDANQTVLTFPRTYLPGVGGWTPPAGVASISYLLVGGGGGGGGTGGATYPAGGGAGGVVIPGTLTPDGSSLQVKVGQGGKGGSRSGSGSDLLDPQGGQDSQFGTASASGGGAGGHGIAGGFTNGANPGPGGGGGGGVTTGIWGGTLGDYKGGSGNGSSDSSKRAGGGGAGAANDGGSGFNSSGGAGGAGAESTITGGTLTYGGGGGGGKITSGTAGAGGSGGGGAGGLSADGTNGTKSLGGGGGGAGGTSKLGGAGGSGVVIVRFVTPTAPPSVSQFSSAQRLIDADSDSDSVRLNWTAVSHSTPVNGYIIEWGTDQNYSNTPISISDGAATSHVVAGLIDGEDYFFRLKAVNAVGSSPNWITTTSIPVSNQDHSFDTGGNSYASAPSSPVIPGGASTDFSVEFWFKRTGDTGILMSQGDDANTFYMKLGGGKLVAHTNGLEEVYDSVVPTGQWKHVALTVDASDAVAGSKLYMDGQLVLTYSGTRQDYTLAAGPSKGFFVGALSRNSSEIVDVEIDQVKIWSDVLAPSEINASMHAWQADTNGDGTPDLDNLVSHYDFNDFTNATTLEDQFGANDLTFNGATLGNLSPLVQADTSVTGRVTYSFPRSYLTQMGGWQVPDGATNFSALVVGAGGGGAGNTTTSTTGSAGSGGGGGVYNTHGLDLSGTLSIIVGLGGLGGTHSSDRTKTGGYQGQSSSLESLIAGGGGGGGCLVDIGTDVPCGSSERIHGLPGTASGSGGSSSNFWNAYNWGVAGEATGTTFGGATLPAISGFAGGPYDNTPGASTTGSSGSAGGAGGAGTYNTPGPGVSSTIPGVSGFFGKGGASWGSTGWTESPLPPNTGAGGSGAGAYGTYSEANGVSGSSGIVVLSYLIPQQNLVLSYNSTDTNSFDASPIVHDLSPSDISGLFNKSMALDETTHGWVFDGAGTYMDVADISSDLFATHGITIDFEADFGSPNDRERILDFGLGQASQNIWLGRAGMTNDLWLELYGAGMSIQVCSAPEAITQGLKRYTVALGPNSCKVFIAGSDVPVVNSPGAKTLPTPGQTLTSNFIGRSNWSFDADFAGQIRSVRVYRGAYSPSEIGAIDYKTITLNASPGTASDISLITSGSVRLPDPNNSSAQFDGWATSGTSSAVANPYTPSSDVTLEALYTSSFSITWDSNGGTAITSPDSFTFGQDISLPTNPTKDGFVFGGWSTSESLDQGAEVDKIASWPYTPAMADQTFYAIWLDELFVYEPLNSGNGTTLDGIETPGSTGLTGTWTKVQGTGSQGAAAAVELATSSELHFPSNSSLLVPDPNSLASDSSRRYNIDYSARQLSRAIDFDVDGVHHISFLAESTSGMAVAGFLSDLPSSTSDTGPWSLLIGSLFGDNLVIDFGNANESVYFSDGYNGDGAQYSFRSSNSEGFNVESRMVIARITTKSGAGQDKIEAMSFGPAESIPANLENFSSWDGSFERAISGTAKYLAIQLEYLATLDEIRVGATYRSVAEPILLDPVVTYSNVTYSPAGSNSPNVTTNGHSGARTYSSATPSVCSVESATGVATILTAGMCSISTLFAAAGGYSEITVSASFNIGKANQAALIWDQSKISYDYLGSLSLSSAISGGNVSIANNVTFLASGNCIANGAIISGGNAASSCSVTATLAGDVNYNPISITQTITIKKIDQSSLAIANPGTVRFGDTIQLNTTGGSGTGAISFTSSTSSVCAETSNDGEFEFVGVGDCIVTATKAPDTNYNSQTGNRTITSFKATHTLSFTSTVPANPVVNGEYTISGVSSTGNALLAPSFRIKPSSASFCEVSGSVVSFKLDGLCEIEAFKDATANYEAAQTITQRIVVGQANQSISFAAPTNRTFGDPAFSVSGTSTSGNAVTFTTGSGTTNSACSVTSAGLVVIGAVGTCEIVANSASGNGYAAASPVARAFEVAPDTAGAPFITAVSFGDQSLTATYFAPSYLGGGTISGYRLQAFDGDTLVATESSCAISGTLSCTVTGLTNGTSYTLKISAITEAGVGAVSPASSAMIPASNPEAVSNLTAVQGDAKLTITWRAPSNLGGGTLDSFRIYHREAGGSYPGAPLTLFAVDVPAATSNGVTTYEITGLTNGQAYDVKVITVTDVNLSNLTSATTEVTQTPYTVPDAPPTVEILEIDDDIVITWSQPVFDGGSAISGYSVLLDSVAATCTATSTTSCTIPKSSLTPGTTVSIDVKAENDAGLSNPASTTFEVASIVVITPDSPAPTQEGPAAEIEAVSGQSWAWTKRISKNEVKVYIKFPEMGANYQISLQKNDGDFRRVMSKTINTTSDTDLRVVGEWYYLVRTITLPGEGRYRIEIAQDGQRMTLNGEDRPAVYSYR